jgi:hypothetical protein
MSWKDRLGSRCLPYDNFLALRDHAAKVGITCFSTAHDEPSFDYLVKEVKQTVFKIGSGEIGNWPYLRKIAATGRPVILSVGMQTPELIVRDMRRYLDEDKSIMLLASCSYMLDPLIRALRAEGIAFHNPYRVKAGAWNPLRGGSEHGTSSIERLLNFREQVPLASAERFDAKKLLSWYEIIKATGNVPRGKRAEIIARLDALAHGTEPQEMDASIFEDGAEGTVVIEPWSAGGLPAMEIFNLFEPDCQLLQYLARPDLERDAVRWLVDNAIAAKSKALEYPARVLEKSGAEALEKLPRVVIGTIHSCQGRRG